MAELDVWNARVSLDDCLQTTTVDQSGNRISRDCSSEAAQLGAAQSAVEAARAAVTEARIRLNAAEAWVRTAEARVAKATAWVERAVVRVEKAIAWVARAVVRVQRAVRRVGLCRSRLALLLDLHHATREQNTWLVSVGHTGREAMAAARRGEARGPDIQRSCRGERFASPGG